MSTPTSTERGARATLYLVPTIDAALEHARARPGAQPADPVSPVIYTLPSAGATGFARRRLGDTLGTHLLTFYSLGQAILDRDGDTSREINDSAISRLVRKLLNDMADRRELTTFTAVREKPGFVQTLMNWLREMKSQGIDPEQVAAQARTSGRERDRQLATLYHRYQTFLQKNNFSDIEGLLWLAAEALERDPNLYADPAPFRVIGFDQFTPIQLRILGYLASRIADFAIYLLWDADRPEESLALTRLKQTKDTLLRGLPIVGEVLNGDHQPVVNPILIHLRQGLFESNAKPIPTSDEPVVRAVAAPSREGEVRWAFREAKKLLQAGTSTEEIAILAPKPAVYRRLVETVADEYGISVRHEQALSDSPAVAALLKLLGLAPAGFPWRETFDILRSPYFKQPWLTEEQIDLLDRLTRERPVVAGRAQWRFALESLAQSMDEIDDEDRAAAPLVAQLAGETLSQIEEGLMAFFDHIQPKEAATYWEHTRWFQESLLGLFVDEQETGETPAETPVSLNFYACCREGETAGRDLAALSQVAIIMRDLVRAAEQVPIQDSRSPLDSSESSLTVEPATSSAPWLDYQVELTRLIRSQTIPPDPTLGALRFGLLAAGRAIVVDHLFVLGLSEGEFPQPPPPDPLYAPAERAARDQPGALPLRYQDPSEDASLWWQILAGVRAQLSLLRPRVDDNGAPWLPSPYWTAVLTLYESVEVIEPPASAIPALEQAAGPAEMLLALASQGGWKGIEVLGSGWKAAQRAAQRAAAVIAQRSSWEPPGEFEGIFQTRSLLAEMAFRFGPNHAWSPSRLNRYGNCPFGYFAQSILGLDARPDPEEGFDALQRGSLLHEVLENLYRRLADAGLAPTVTEKKAVLAHLEASCDALFPDAPGRYGFRPGPMWRYEREEIRRQLRALVSWECEQNGSVARFRPFLQEMRFGIRGGRVGHLQVEAEDGFAFYLHGVIDRIDLDANGLAQVIDYKSGRSGYSKSDVTRGLATQVALYALAAEQMLPEITRVVESAYLHIPSRKKSGKILIKEGAADDSQIEDTVTSAAAFVRRTRAGIFPSAPAKPAAGATACRTGCEFAGLCRVSRTSIAKARRLT